MTVAQVVLTLDHGGQERLVIDLAERLEQKGTRSPIVVLRDGVLVPEARERGLEVITLGKREGLDLRMIGALVRIVRQQRIQVMHTHNLAPLVYGTLAARICRIASVNTRHGRARLNTSPLIWRLTDAVVTVSEDARRELLACNRIAEGKVRVVLNGIDTGAYHRTGSADARTALGLPPDVPVVGAVGRLSPEKDHRSLLLAMKMLVDAGSPAHLVIVGGGPLESELKALVSALGLATRVHLPGFRSDVPALLGAFDVFVLSSTMEGVSLTLLEAMAAGLPVVATAVGGTPEVVQDGHCGLLVPPDDPASLAAALGTLLSDGTARRALSERGRAVVVEQFDLTRVVDAYSALYDDVASRRRIRLPWVPATDQRS